MYPDIQGIPPLKREISRFVKNFLDVTVDPEHCLPTVGSMMGAMACFLTINRMYAEREGTLFIDPGFPVQKLQCRVLGHDFMSFDVYDHRGPRLRDKLRSYLDTGKVSSILYSNPNNPAWICLTEAELEIIARLADEYEVVVIEDLAYFGMDFRHDYSRPGVAPFQPSVARHTDNFVLLISSSKVFSYAGERIGMLVVSDALWNKRAPDLRRVLPVGPAGLRDGVRRDLRLVVRDVALGAVRPRGRAEGRERRRTELRRRRSRVRREGARHEAHVHRQRLPDRLRHGPGRAHRRRVLFHVLVPGPDGRGTPAGTAVLRRQRDRAGHHGQRAHGGPPRLHVAHPALRSFPALDERLAWFHRDHKGAAGPVWKG